MAKQIKSMKAVRTAQKLSVDAYEKLGVQVLNADGSLRDSDTVYWEVIDALGKCRTRPNAMRLPCRSRQIRARTESADYGWRSRWQNSVRKQEKPDMWFLMKC